MNYKPEKHFTLTTTFNDELLDDAIPIEDPFIYSKITVPFRDLIRALFTRRKIVIKIRVDGDILAYRGVATIDWDLLRQQNSMRSIALSDIDEMRPE